MDGSPEDRQTVRVAIWRVRDRASALPTYMAGDAPGCDLAGDLDAPLTLAPSDRDGVPRDAVPPDLEWRRCERARTGARCGSSTRRGGGGACGGEAAPPPRRLEKTGLAPRSTRSGCSRSRPRSSTT